MEGGIDCRYGCIGFGDCVKACPVDAIAMHNGRVHVNTKTCIGCGNCAKACPRNLFELLPIQDAKQLYYVGCHNKEKGPRVKKVCQRGCIACGICVKVAPSCYTLKDNLSYVIYEKTPDNKGLEEGKNKCPTKCIFYSDV